MQFPLSKIIIAFLSVVILVSPAAARRAPIVLDPSGHWVVDYADDSCRLVRQFGTGDDKAIVIFNRFEPGDDFQLTLAGEPFRFGQSNGRAKLKFGPTEVEQKHGFARGNFSGNLPALVFRGFQRIAPLTEYEKEQFKSDTSGEYVLPPISEERKAAVDRLLIGHPLSRRVALNLGAMDKPFAALSICMDELMTHWGIDVIKHKHLSKPVRPDRTSYPWFMASDYPTFMLKKKKQNLVQVRLSVDEKGQPSACHIQQSTNQGAYDERICKAYMRRAKFFPALDKEGIPIASYYRLSVNFWIPR